MKLFLFCLGFSLMAALIVLCAIWSSRIAGRIQLRNILNKDRLWIDPDAKISARAGTSLPADQPVGRPVTPPDCRRSSLANTGQQTPQPSTGRFVRPRATRAVIILPALIRHRCVVRVH